VTNHIGDKSTRWQSTRWRQVGDRTGVSQFGDSHNLSTNHIFRPYTSRVCLHLAKFIVENNFLNYILAGVPAFLALFRQWINLNSNSGLGLR